MTAELIPPFEPLSSSEAEVIPIIRPEDALTPEELELAMQIAQILSAGSVAVQRSVAEHSLFEAEQSGASDEVLQGLKHTVRLWRTVQIDTTSIPPK